MSIPHLILQDMQQKTIVDSPEARGYVRRTLEGYFTLDGSSEVLKAGVSVECKATVANDTCATTNSLDVRVLVPTTSKSAVQLPFGWLVTFSAGYLLSLI